MHRLGECTCICGKYLLLLCKLGCMCILYRCFRNMRDTAIITEPEVIRSTLKISKQRNYSSVLPTCFPWRIDGPY